MHKELFKEQNSLQIGKIPIDILKGIKIDVGHWDFLGMESQCPESWHVGEVFTFQNL